jgi:hypothetical protein
MTTVPNDDLKALIRTIPDFPKPGIQFRDITTLLLDARGFAATVERLAAGITGKPDLIAGTEARGFIFAAALAHRLGAGLSSFASMASCPARRSRRNMRLNMAPIASPCMSTPVRRAPASSWSTTSLPPAAPRSPPPA